MKTFLFPALFLLIGAVAPARERPNILLVYTDDHSHRAVESENRETVMALRTKLIEELRARGAGIAENLPAVADLP